MNYCYLKNSFKVHILQSQSQLRRMQVSDMWDAMRPGNQLINTLFQSHCVFSIVLGAMFSRSHSPAIKGRDQEEREGILGIY